MQSNQWGYAPGPQNVEDNFMRYCPPPQDDLCHYPHGGWKYQQGMREYEQSSEMSYLPEPQKTSSIDYAFNTFKQDCSPVPQNDPYIDEYNNYSCCEWKDQNQIAFNSPYSTYQEPSSLESTFNAFMQNSPTPPPSFSFEDSSSLDYLSTQNSFQNSQPT
ncbi:hypothetical protein AHAS_Ahas15G0182100 [Arachis hypogaea]